MQALETAKQLFIASLDLLAQGNYKQAEINLLQAHQLLPERPSILVNLVAVQLQLDKFEEAYANAKLAISIDAGQPETWMNWGIAAHALGMSDEAIAHFEAALQRKPDLEQAWFHKGLVHLGLKQNGEAQNCFSHTVALNPNNFNAVFSLASVHRKLGHYDLAIDLFVRATASNEHQLRAVQNLIVIHGDTHHADALANLVAQHHDLIQDNALCHELLGFSYFNANDPTQAGHHFKQAALLSENKPNVNNPVDWPIPEPRLRHDHEQLSLLEARGQATSASRHALAVLSQYKHLVQEKNQTLVGQSARDDAALMDAMGGYHHLPTPQFEGRALGSNDFSKIEAAFHSGSSKLVVIDNFLSEEALLALRTYCEEATIWKRSYPNGYLGSFMASGFGSPVILEIARQLKIAMPTVVGPEPLRQAWGFKYDQRMTGINLHADFARVNINFWLTPDDACLDNTSGGLVVYDMPPPDDWSFEEANYNSQKIKDYLDSKQAKMIRVPYKMNRCVLFDSTYFHATDDIHFKPGYENRRVNCTLLFGDGL